MDIKDKRVSCPGSILSTLKVITTSAAATEDSQEHREPPTIVVIALDVLGSLVQAVLIQLLLGQFMPEANIQGTIKGGELQLGQSRVPHCHGSYRSTKTKTTKNRAEVKQTHWGWKNG